MVQNSLFCKESDCNFFDNCIKGHNTFKLNCNHNTVLLKMTLKPIAILKGSCNSCKVLYQRRSSIFLDYFQRGLLFEFLKGDLIIEKGLVLVCIRQVLLLIMGKLNPCTNHSKYLLNFDLQPENVAVLLLRIGKKKFSVIWQQKG